MNWQWKMAIAAGGVILLLAIGGAIGWKWRDANADKHDLRRAKATIASLHKERADREAQLASERARAAVFAQQQYDLGKKERATRIIRKVEYAKAPYVACPLPADGLRLIRDAERDTLSPAAR